MAECFKYSYETYSFNREKVDQWKSFLDLHGFVVIKRSITRNEAEAAVNDFWNIIESISAIRRDDSDSLKDTGSYPHAIENGIIQYIGHSEVQWRLRELTASIFANLYNVAVTDLLTSFDGFCLATQYNAKASGNGSDIAKGLHTDQVVTETEPKSYQGLLNLLPNDAESGGFVCVPRSHAYHSSYFHKHQPGLRSASMFYRFSDQEKQEEPELFRAIKVDAGPGDFVLWDSRTFHCNTGPRNDRLRLCTYINMMPKTGISQESLEKRRTAVKRRLNTFHHPIEVTVVDFSLRNMDYLLPDSVILAGINSAAIENVPLRSHLAIGEEAV